MIHILSLGDSYTIGESVEPAERWPVQLAELLRTAGLPVADPQILARTGWTTGELAGAIVSAEFDPPYDLVTLLIGVNNQYRGYPLAAYREEFRSLLQTAIDFAGGDPGRVIVVSIPDWGMTPFAGRDARGPETITAEVAAFNIVNNEESGRLSVRYVDIFAVSQLAYEDDSLIAGDGLHPSGAQYTLWAEAVLPVAVEILKLE